MVEYSLQCTKCKGGATGVRGPDEPLFFKSVRDHKPASNSLRFWFFVEFFECLTLSILQAYFQLKFVSSYSVRVA